MAAGGHVEYAMTIRTAAPFAEAIARVRRALKAQGFSVLTEIDVRATVRDKLGEDMEDYLILGACNSSLARQARGPLLHPRGAMGRASRLPGLLQEPRRR